MTRLASRSAEASEPVADRPAPLVNAPRLIVVAYAVAPGPGGPESFVNAQLLRALAEHWPAGVTVITGGSAPALNRGGRTDLPGWSIHSLGEFGERELARGRFAAWCSQATTGLRSVPGRALNRIVHWRTGHGLKTFSWQLAARRLLRHALAAGQVPLP